MDKPQDRCAELLEEIKMLSELNGENPFKIRAFDKAQPVVSACQDLEKRAREGTLTELSGIGKGISEILTEFLLKGTSRARDELLSNLPAGLTELVRVPGLGPKKARQLVEELGIHSLGELEYACKENRLLKLKGFGEKLQAKVLEGLLFLSSNQDRARIVDVLEHEHLLLESLRKAIGSSGEVESTGSLRRRLEVLNELEFLVGLSKEKFDAMKKKSEKAVADFRKDNSGVLRVELRFCDIENFGSEWARTTGTTEHWKALGAPSTVLSRNEKEFFKKLNIEWIAPELRETGEEVELARQGKLGTLLSEQGVQGVFHNHTTRSDGTASLEEMVREARSLGYKYIGISDHSQSAFYAQGLKADDLKAQEKEIRQIQEKYPDIRVFWGVESDILADGELDYPVSILKKFDFVVASIHSRFKMEKKEMTQRILKAIRNPHTRFVGHLTGRLLLGRPGYDLDMDLVLKEAAQHQVAIEINANPARLDIDWRWGPLLRKYETPVSVNPDAHSLSGLRDTAFGVTVARKALLPQNLVVNSRSSEEIGKWLLRA